VGAISATPPPSRGFQTQTQRLWSVTGEELRKELQISGGR